MAFFACSTRFFHRELVGVAAFMRCPAALGCNFLLPGRVHGSKTALSGFAFILQDASGAIGLGVVAAGTGTALIAGCTAFAAVVYRWGSALGIGPVACSHLALLWNRYNFIGTEVLFRLSMDEQELCRTRSVNP